MSNEFPIDSHITSPKKVGRGAPPKYPFKLLGMEQSFFVPRTEADTPAVLLRRMELAAGRVTRLTGWKFVCKPWEQGVRVWRIE